MASNGTGIFSRVTNWAKTPIVQQTSLTSATLALVVLMCVIVLWYQVLHEME